MRPVTYDVPKALVPLRNQPFMGYMIDFLRGGGIEKATLSMGYLPDPIQEYFSGRKDLDDFSISYAVEEKALGTAGGLKNAAGDVGEGPVIAVNGDVLSGLNLRELISAHEDSDALATITLTSVEDPTAYGLVEVDSEMLVHRFLEKPAYDEVTTNMVNAGIYVLEPEVLEMIPDGREVSIEREIFPRIQARGRLRAHVSSAYWRDIGTPRSYIAASHDVLSGAVGAKSDFEYLDIDPSTRMGESVKVLPPVSVAGECEIGSHATVGGRSALGRGCTIGEGAVVEGSVLFDGARIEAGAVVRGSIVGPGARVGENAIVRGLSMLGARCVIGERNVLDQGIRINPSVVVPPRSLNF